ALNNYFSPENVFRGNKAFDIHENTYRVDADVLPALAYRYYYDDAENSEDYVNPTGVAFLTDDKIRINNWPKQVYDNGVSKQKVTRERYKKMVRIIKKLRNKMADEKISEALDVSSFLIESLVWNVPNKGFYHDKYFDDVRYVVANCFNETKNDERCKNTREVNNIKYLFHSSQPWTRAQAHSFFDKAWDYIGFK
ncbi:MAG: nucleotidyltransferase, partial [Candidatus Dadabacteria bacterium]|nr:nucleotidyltransferase [Candidatus Dadabacteria bacterium]